MRLTSGEGNLNLTRDKPAYEHAAGRNNVFLSVWHGTLANFLEKASERNHSI